MSGVLLQKDPLTLNSDAGLRCGGVFRQVEGGKPPDCFSLSYLCLQKKTRWEWQRHLRALVIWPALLPHRLVHPFAHACSSLVDGRTPRAPDSSLFSCSFLRLGWPFSSTHPLRLSSQELLRGLLRCLHRTDHPDMTLTQPFAQFVVCAILSFTVDPELRTSKSCVQFIPNTLQSLHPEGTIGDPVSYSCPKFSSQISYLGITFPPLPLCTHNSRVMQPQDCRKKSFGGARLLPAGVAAFSEELNQESGGFPHNVRV